MNCQRFCHTMLSYVNVGIMKFPSHSKVMVFSTHFFVLMGNSLIVFAYGILQFYPQEFMLIVLYTTSSWSLVNIKCIHYNYIIASVMTSTIVDYNKSHVCLCVVSTKGFQFMLVHSIVVGLWHVCVYVYACTCDQGLVEFQYRLCSNNTCHVM